MIALAVPQIAEPHLDALLYSIHKEGYTAHYQCSWLSYAAPFLTAGPHYGIRGLRACRLCECLCPACVSSTSASAHAHQWQLSCVSSSAGFGAKFPHQEIAVGILDVVFIVKHRQCVLKATAGLGVSAAPHELLCCCFQMPSYLMKQGVDNSPHPCNVPPLLILSARRCFWCLYDLPRSAERQSPALTVMHVILLWVGCRLSGLGHDLSPQEYEDCPNHLGALYSWSNDRRHFYVQPTKLSQGRGIFLSLQTGCAPFSAMFDHSTTANAVAVNIAALVHSNACMWPKLPSKVVVHLLKPARDKHNCPLQVSPFDWRKIKYLWSKSTDFHSRLTRFTHGMSHMACEWYMALCSSSSSNSIPQ